MAATGHYHLNIKTGSRSGGQSASAKYDYISRGGKYERTRTEDVLHLESGNMPSFAEADPRAYWAAADDHERANGRLFRSMDIALPNDLTPAEQLRLAQEFTAHVTGGDLPYTMAIHAGRSTDGRPDNPHMHLVFSERVNDGLDRPVELWFRRAAAGGRDPETGGAAKTDRTKPREWLEETRAGWKVMANRALEQSGSHIRIDHRTLEAQRAAAEARGDEAAARELDREPQMHRGPILSHRFAAAHEAAPDRLQAFIEFRDRRNAEAQLEQRIEEQTDELRELELAQAAAYDAVLAAVPAEAIEAATQPIAAPPPALICSAAALAAERQERNRIAAVPAATWHAVEAATEPVARRPPAAEVPGLIFAYACRMWRPGDPDPPETFTVGVLDAERDRRLVEAVPADTWRAAEAATQPIAAPPPAPAHTAAALAVERDRRAAEAEAEREEDRAAADRPTLLGAAAAAVGNAMTGAMNSAADKAVAAIDRLAAHLDERDRRRSRAAAAAVEAPAPDVEAPAAPAVEAPVVEAPAVEAPVVEAPVVEAPVVKAPAAPDPHYDNKPIPVQGADRPAGGVDPEDIDDIDELEPGRNRSTLDR